MYAAAAKPPSRPATTVLDAAAASSGSLIRCSKNIRSLPQDQQRHQKRQQHWVARATGSKQQQEAALLQQRKMTLWTRKTADSKSIWCAAPSKRAHQTGDLAESLSTPRRSQPIRLRLQHMQGGGALNISCRLLSAGI
jgi:hypothetical protein